MKKKLVLLALIINSFVAYSQPSEKDEPLLQEGKDAILAGNIEEAIEIFKKCISLNEGSEEINPQKNDCLINLAQAYEQKEDYALALEAYLQQLEIFKAAGEEAKMTVAYAHIGRMNEVLSNYEESKKNYNDGLQLAEKTGNKLLKTEILIGLGKVNALQGNNFGGVEYYQKANKLAQEIDSRELVVSSLDGIAGVYEKIFFYKDALVYRSQYREELKKLADQKESLRAAELADLQATYEGAVKEKEATILAQQKQLEALEKKETVKTLETVKESPVNLIASFSAVLVAFLAVGFYYKRDRKTKKQLSLLRAAGKTEEQERLRISKGIHDDLRSGLTRINMLSEMIFQKTSHLPDVKSNSEAVKETAKKMFESTWDLIWALNPENTSIANLIGRMKEFAKDYLDESDIEPVFHIPEQLPETIITKESHTELYLVVKESLNNISRHAAASKVFFTANLHRDILLITIIDNGNGFIVGSESAGTGLKSMSKRLQDLGGVWEVTSKIGQGTMISISVSLDLIKSTKKRLA